jgi:Uma2 family endonuclease
VTALTQPPGRLLTISDYAALGEDDRTRWELQEGNLVMSPSPSPRHMLAASRLWAQVSAQLPIGLVAIQDVDVDLQLESANQPGTSRRPDLIVVAQAEVDHVDLNGGLLRATRAAVVAEIVSPGSRRTDHVIKRGEYADAGIPHYWIVDIDAPVSLIACHLAGGFGYQDAPAVTNQFAADEPFRVRLDLDQLR